MIPQKAVPLRVVPLVPAQRPPAPPVPLVPPVPPAPQPQPVAQTQPTYVSSTTMTEGMNTEPRLGPETLLCTYSRKTTSRAVMAEDGLCDYAIYDSLYANHVNKLSGTKQLEQEVYAFLSAANDYKRTTLGVGFAFQHLKEVEKDLQPRSPSPLEVFWERKVFHAGIIDTPAEIFGPKLKEAIFTLKVCKHTRYAANLKYVPEHYAVLTSLDTKARVFTYDNEKGLNAKLCRVKSEELDVDFGIAAFDVDYDDYSNVCGSINKFGRHSRLKTLRRIVDYYRRLTSTDFAEASCMAIVP
ncbi:hypothetical protein V5799_021095 [Amblyomma americanum]|uniref:Uncharacterized protein n=1 Tax=Amblyomma americanum TaxID=6943 RepID=A0AAQ4FS21_AMBAM